MEKRSHIQWEEDDGIGILTIDNPPANSLGEQVLIELGGALDDLSSTSVRAPDHHGRPGEDICFRRRH